MADRTGAQVRGLVERWLDELSAAEQVSLLAGIDMWHTAPVERFGIPSVRVTDGPAGARGTSWMGPASINVPCGTALAATWDPGAVERIGRLLGVEARRKGARLLLAPTVNLHRTAIGGRNFECMSEDPWLTSRIAVAYVRGVQAQGVGCCIKHFVANDTEHERMTIDNRVDERTLRELYLVPFEAAVKEADVAAVMTAYNRVNGLFAADHRELLTGVLRGEWGFDGLVVSDWFGLHSTVEALEAGVDLEMPGPTRHRGDRLLAALDAGAVTREQIRRAAGHVLTFLVTSGAYDDGSPGPETTSERPEDLALVRDVAAASIVLLKNDRATLPLQPPALGRVAVIGPNAAGGQVMGGGSAQVTPTRVVQVLDALERRLGALGVEVAYAEGCSIRKRLAPLERDRCGPLHVDYFADPGALEEAGAVPDRVQTVSSTRVMWQQDPFGRRGVGRPFGARLRTTFTPDTSGQWSFSVESVAPATVSIDGTVILDNRAVPRGGSFFGVGRSELRSTIPLVAGQAYDVVAEVRHGPSDVELGGINLGALAPEPGDTMAEAEAAARRSDLSVVVVGTNADWEAEGWDRASIGLPGRQDELVARVSAVSRRTVVVVNAGSPVAMPWLDQVDAVLVSWFGGQEMGDAVADVLLGDEEPQGRLPTTFPATLEDTPAFEHHPGRNGTAHYREGRLIGYRWFATVGREPRFAFGFGLGYADVRITGAELTGSVVVADLANRSDRDGVQVVQVYAGPAPSVDAMLGEPAKRLVGFEKVRVPARGMARAEVTLDPRAFSTWSEEEHRWREVPYDVVLHVGVSARDIAFTLPVARRTRSDGL